MSDENQALFWSPPQDAKLHATFSGHSPTRPPFQDITATRCAPDTPPEKQLYSMNSDDFLRTSEVAPSEELRTLSDVQQPRKTVQPLVIVGSEEPITLGRASAATIRIGKRDRQISRIHATIEYNHTAKEYQLITQGLNGVMVDGKPCKQHERASLKNDSRIDIIGYQVIFMYPSITPSQKVLDVKTPEETQSTDSPLSASAAPASSNDNTSAADTAADAHADVDTAIQTAHVEPEAPIIKQNDGQQQAENAHVQAETTTNEAPAPRGAENVDSAEKSKDAAVDNKDTTENKNNATEQDMDYTEVVISALVFSRKSSMPVSDICSRVMATNPLFKQQSREVWMTRIERLLHEKPFFGEIVRKGKTADGSPKENLYYYRSELDPIEWRRSTYTQVGRSARKCTLQDKQYFWKIPPKLGRNRNNYVPPPAKTSEHEHPKPDMAEAPAKRAKGKKTEDAASAQKKSEN